MKFFQNKNINKKDFSNLCNFLSQYLAKKDFLATNNKLTEQFKALILLIFKINIF